MKLEEIERDIKATTDAVRSLGCAAEDVAAAFFAISHPIPSPQELAAQLEPICLAARAIEQKSNRLKTLRRQMKRKGRPGWKRSSR